MSILNIQTFIYVEVETYKSNIKNCITLCVSQNGMYQNNRRLQLFRIDRLQFGSLLYVPA